MRVIVLFMERKVLESLGSGWYFVGGTVFYYGVPIVSQVARGEDAYGRR